MADTINRTCPFCGEKLKAELYPMCGGRIEYCAYCDSCHKFCTDNTLPTRVAAELNCIEKN